MRSIPAQIKSYAPGFALALVIALLAKGIEALLPFDVIGASVIAMFSSGGLHRQWDDCRLWCG